MLAAELDDPLVQFFYATKSPLPAQKTREKWGTRTYVVRAEEVSPPLLRIEFDFYQFFGLVGRRLELPVAYSRDCTLREDGMAALDVHGLYGAIGRDADFEFDHAPDVHGLGEGWVSCRSLHDDFPASIGGFLGPGLSQSEDECDRNEEGDVALPQRGLHIKQI